MTKLYLANSGSYSDYGVQGIFSTKEGAEKLMHAFNEQDWNEIEEWELDEHLDELNRGLTHYCVRMYKDGSVIEAKPDLYSPHICGGAVHWMDRAYWNPTQPWANFYVWATGSEHAVKVANERRIAALALPSPQGVKQE